MREYTLSILFLITSVFTFSDGIAQTPFNGVSVQEVLIPDSVLLTIDAEMGGVNSVRCWRVYVCMDDPDWEMQAIYGNNDYPMVVQVEGGTFYQNTLAGGFLAANINPAFFQFFPELEFDSWFAIGLDNNTSQVAYTPAPPDPVTPFNTAGTTGFVVNDPIGFSIFGTWLPPDSQGQPDADNKLLVAQFTTDGIWNATLNFIFRRLNPDGSVYIPVTTIDILGVNIDGTPGAEPESCPIVFLAGCTDPAACNYDPNVTIDDGSCILPDGCTDPGACNYDPSAICDDGSCLFIDDCGNCDPLSQYGCTDVLAPNYNSNATCDDGSCCYDHWVEFILDGEDIDGIMPTYDLILLENDSVIISGIFDDDVLVYELFCLPDGCYSLDVFGGQYPYPISVEIFDLGIGELYANSCCSPYSTTFYIGDGVCNGDCLDESACNYNPNALFDDGSCTYPGCTNGLACNYNPASGCEDGSCILPDGCTDPTACNYSDQSNCDDGSCLYFDVCGNCGGNSSTGCVDPIACNYDPIADCDDGTCEFLTCAGCTDDSSCNYDLEATIDDGSCLTFDECGNCGGDSVSGCMDNSACNYNSLAGCSDDSCTYPGCTDGSAANYDPEAGCDDGSCISSYGTYLVPDVFGLMYNETLDLEIWIENGVDIYAVFAFMEFDNVNWTFSEAIPGPYLGNEILPTAPVVIDNTIDFGLTKTGPLPGSNGDGLLYTLRFTHNEIPLQVGPFISQFTTISVDAYNSLGEIGGLQNPNPDATVELIFEAEVWPGDCDHNGEVSFLDLLPIGFFYNNAGPVRSDATIQWVAQPAPLWGTDNNSPSSSYFKVFADGDGDGLINISDQAAIGFNLGQTVPDGFMEFDWDEEIEFVAAIQEVEIPLEISSAPSSAVIPIDNEVIFSVNVTTDLETMEDLYGFGLELTFPLDWVSTSDPTIDYTNTDLGTLGVDFLSFVNVTSGTIEIAITRTLPMTMSGDIHLFDVIVPLEENLLPGTKEMLVDVVAANDPSGIPVSITPASGFVNITNELLGFEVLLSTSNTICIGGGQGMAQASSSGGTEPYVYDWNGADPNDLMAGDYTLTVTDSDGVSEIVDFTIQDGLAICGCTYPDATNFDPIAQVDDGSCEFPPSGTETCEGDFSGDGSITTVDLLIFLALYDSECPE